MKQEEVPQDDGLNMVMREITYATDHTGYYIKVPSLGWTPKNIANDKAWEQVNKQIQRQIHLLRKGKRSPLAYYMVLNLMDPGLLASYMRISRWRVKRHLKPKIFWKLDAHILKQYAQLFEISLEQLKYPEAIYNPESRKEQNGNPV